MSERKRARSWYEIKAQDGAPPEIFVYEDIGFFGVSPKDFVADLNALPPSDKIVLRIASKGGSPFDAVVMYNALRRNPAEIEVWIDGLAASAASMLAMAGDRIIMPENTWMMIHDAQGVAMGDARTMRATAEALDRVGASIQSLYATKTSLPRKEIAELMAAESWFTAQEAVDKGFADEIAAPVEISNSFDLSGYEHVPAALKAEITASPQLLVDVARYDAAESVTDRIRAALAASPGEISEIAAPQQREGAEMDPKELTIATLRAERPDLVAELSAPSEAALEEARVTARAEAAEAERTRVAGIRDLTLPGFEALGEACIGDGTTTPEGFAKRQAEAQKAKAQAHLDNERAADPAPIAGRRPEALPAAGSVSGGASSEDPAQRRAVFAEAIAARCMSREPTIEAAREFVHMSVVDLAKAIVPELARFKRPDQVIENALTTSDFPYTLGAGMDKILLSRYEEYPTTYMSISRPMALRDFKQKTLIRFGDFPSLLEVQPDGEYTYGGPGEHPEYIQLRTYGRLLSITRQALINDDLGAFDDFGVMVGEAVRRFENKTVWAVVTTNADLSDGTALFHADHGNLAGTPGAPSAASIGAAKAAMRKQRSIDGETINLEPATIAVPSDLETAVEQLLSDLIVPTTPSELTPRSQRQLAQVTEPLLDANSTTAWYIFAQQSRRAGLVYANLSGVAGPETFVDDHFSRDGMTIKVRRDFAAAAEDYRGLYKDAGS